MITIINKLDFNQLMTIIIPWSNINHNFRLYLFLQIEFYSNFA